MIIKRGMAVKKLRLIARLEKEVRGMQVVEEIDGDEIALVSFEEDGGFIVKACNAHDQLVEALTMGASANTPSFLHWVADRLVHVYGESENVDFVLSLRDRANAMNEVLIEIGEL